MTVKIQAQITFNAHKHHFQFLLKEIIKWRQLEWEHVEPEILLMCENLLDFYTGCLSVESIVDECDRYFFERQINEKTAFLNWLQPVEYRKIVLSDISQWIVKRGNDNEKFIHIHPAKQSPHTIRMRAATLKTVVTLMIKKISISPQMNDNLIAVNNIRTEYLHLSPVKSLQQGKGIFKLWEIFATHY